jgi:uncharacterized membrane protein
MLYLYTALKALHVLAVVVFVGNIITGVFWKVHADLTGELRARAQALAGLIKADRIFTLPGVLLIVATGVSMVLMSHLSFFGTPWILWPIVLFTISGLAFAVKVAPLQKRMLANVEAGITGSWDRDAYDAMSRSWTIWGTVATLAPVAAIFVMVMKPS